MRTTCFLLAAWLFVLPACSAEDDGTKPGRWDGSEYGGAFYVTFTLVETSCAVAPPLDGIATIEIAGDTIVWGSMRGPWDAEARHGSGESVAPVCIPINPSTGCIGCSTMSFDVVYASVDSFSGTFATHFSYTAACGNDSCSTYYTISGSR